MDVAIAGEDDDLVSVDAEGGFFDALAEAMDPEGFAGDGIEADRVVIGGRNEIAALDRFWREIVGIVDRPKNGKYQSESTDAIWVKAFRLGTGGIPGTGGSWPRGEKGDWLEASNH